MTQTHTIQIDGPAGLLETSLDIPNACTSGIAFLAHPLTSAGGTKDHKVVRTLSKSLVSAGYIVVRPNLRGAGASDGFYDGGLGETQDFLHVIEAVFEIRGVAEMLPANGRVIFGGFSFGTYVASLASEVRRPAALIFAGMPVNKFAFTTRAARTFVVHGQNDEVVRLSDVLGWAQIQELPVTVIPGANHAFGGKLALLERSFSSAAALI